MAPALRLAVSASLSAVLVAADLTPRSWEDAIKKAHEISDKIVFKERRAFAHGVKVFDEKSKYKVVPSHKGYTRRVKDLQVPGLKMEDGASGYHTLHDAVGSATCFPSMLGLASTWDPKMAQAYGAAIGAEFKGKGANVLLGPSLSVNRAADDGRNVNSLSGEDPHLGASLAREYVSGVQGAGVIAAPKNFAFEEPRKSLSYAPNVLVEEDLAWQLYYPPFQAAAEAGALAMMCPGNMVNGVAACGNKQLLTDDLRDKMGFKGFVLSDWGATMPAGMNIGGVKMLQNGLDLEMPMENILSNTMLMFADKKGDGETQRAFDTSLQHMLGSIYKLGLDGDEGCGGPHQCFEAMHVNVTSDRHTALARSVATESVTLLKNTGVLPLDGGSAKKLAIIGAAALATQDLTKAGEFTADYYSAGGAEHCRTAAVVTPLMALSRRAARLGIEVVVSASDNVDEAVAAATEADVAIVIAGATSKDIEKRTTLDLDGNASLLIKSVAAKQHKTVVLMQTPGAVLTPWRDEVAAIANLFLAGQETGHAWAATVFGDVSPAGKLPVMFPASKEHAFVQRAADTEKGEDPNTISYTEGMATSYRNNALKPAFPFGHGLSYTTFSYGQPRILEGCAAKVCVGLNVTNTGSRRGSEVAQAYLQFPNVAKMPLRVLRGFQKTRVLSPGESHDLVFAFSERDLQTYLDGAWWNWDNVIARFGGSSEDLRQRIGLNGQEPAAEEPKPSPVASLRAIPAAAPKAKAAPAATQKAKAAPAAAQKAKKAAPAVPPKVKAAAVAAQKAKAAHAPAPKAKVAPKAAPAPKVAAHTAHKAPPASAKKQPAGNLRKAPVKKHE